MSIDGLLKERMSQLLFLEVEKATIGEIFGVSLKEQVYIPIKTSNILSGLQSDSELKNIPVSFFVEGMFFILGLDKDFRFNEVYINLLEKRLESWSKVAKSAIYDLVNEEKYMDAYIMLKGLAVLENNRENCEKLLRLADKLRIVDKRFREEELKVIETTKMLNYPEPFLYEAIIYNDDGKYREALDSLEKFLEQGGIASEEIISLKSELSDLAAYDSGKEYAKDDPEKALRYLLPLLDSLGDNSQLYYYIAVAYRGLGNHEKAIYYLNEALAIDSALVEVVNELGLNYACLSSYEQAIMYFRKAFEATRSIEICTNLIMCYLNSGNIEQARLHLNIAEKIDPRDEIVLQLKSILEGEKS